MLTKILVSPLQCCARATIEILYIARSYTKLVTRIARLQKMGAYLFASPTPPANREILSSSIFWMMVNLAFLLLDFPQYQTLFPFSKSWYLFPSLPIYQANWSCHFQQQIDQDLGRCSSLSTYLPPLLLIQFPLPSFGKGSGQQRRRGNAKERRLMY